MQYKRKEYGKIAAARFQASMDNYHKAMKRYEQLLSEGKKAKKPKLPVRRKKKTDEQKFKELSKWRGIEISRPATLVQKKDLTPDLSENNLDKKKDSEKS